MTIRTTLLAASALAVLAAAPVSAQALRMMTGPQGGAWYPLGGAIQNMVQTSMPGVSVQVLPGGGVANVKAIATGRADIAFANSVSTVDAMEGRGAFEEKVSNVCNVATLYPQYFQIVTLKSAGVNSVADLRGKALATQPRGNTAEEISREVLDAAGLNYEALSTVHFVSYSDGVSLMKDNNAQAMMLGTTVPASSVMDLANATDISVIPLDDAMMAEMKRRNPGFTPLTIKANTYPGQTGDVQAIGYATHMIARCDLDPAVVEGMLKAMTDNMGDLVAITSAMRDLDRTMMATDIGVPMHEGAKRFFQ
jgi:TRAP transporter TAXI family solute receptor